MEENWNKCTVTFMNQTNMSFKEIEDIFRNFSKSPEIRDYKGRIFVKLGDEAEAACAVSCLQKQLNVHYAKGRSENYNSRKMNDGNELRNFVGTPLYNNHPNKYMSNSSFHAQNMSMGNKSEIGKRMQMTENPQNLPDLRNISNHRFPPSYFAPNDFPHRASSMVEPVKSFNTNSSSLSSDSNNPPALIDMKNVQKMNSIILANLPVPFAVVDVLNLVEECEPIGLTEPQHTKGNKLKYCQVYLKSSQDVEYVKKKLDRFVIGGKKLIAIEPSECLGGNIWPL